MYEKIHKLSLYPMFTPLRRHFYGNTLPQKDLSHTRHSLPRICQGDETDVCGGIVLENLFRTLSHRGACGHHIVHDGHILPPEGLWHVSLIDSAGILTAFLCREVGLRSALMQSDEHIFHRHIHHGSNPSGEQARLMVTALTYA